MIQVSPHLSGNCNESHIYPLVRIPFGCHWSCCSNTPGLAQKRHLRTKQIQGIHMDWLRQLNSALFQSPRRNVQLSPAPFSFLICHVVLTGKKVPSWGRWLSVALTIACDTLYAQPAKTFWCSIFCQRRSSQLENASFLSSHKLLLGQETLLLT